MLVVDHSFLKPLPTILPMVRFGLSKPPGHGHLHNAHSDLMHHQYRLSVLQWNPGSARRSPTKIIAATCGRFHAVLLQEGSDHVPQVSDQSIAYTGDTVLAILLNRDTFERNAAVFVFHEASTNKDTWGMVVLVVRVLLRRPFPFRPSHGHVLLCPHSQCCGQEARCLHWLAPTSTRSRGSVRCRLLHRWRLQHEGRTST